MRQRGRDSPGRTASTSSRTAPRREPVAAGVVVHTVFEAADNVGITALEVRPGLGPPNSSDAYLEIGQFRMLCTGVHLLTRGTVRFFDRDD